MTITTLSSRQIVSGKLGSAVLQMMVYYSALSPCIAFTYLLRGIDIITIMLFLFYTFLASLILSVFGLLVATITHIRHLQVLLSVVLLLKLVGATIGWCSLAVVFVTEADSVPFDEAEFWIQMGPRFVHIRYFGVRDEAGEYLGTLEMTQDIAPMRALEGERRLLAEFPGMGPRHERLRRHTRGICCYGCGQGHDHGHGHGHGFRREYGHRQRDVRCVQRHGYHPTRGRFG